MMDVSPPTFQESHAHQHQQSSSKSRWMSHHLDLRRPLKIEHEIEWLSRKKLVTKILSSDKFKVHLETILKGHIDGTSSKIRALHQLKLRVVSADQIELAHREALLSLGRDRDSAPPTFQLTTPTGIKPINDIVNEYCYSIEEREARCKLASLYRLIDRMGWTQLIFNHISLRAPGEQEQFLLNAFGLHYSEITASNLVKVDIEGNVIDPGSTKLGISKAGYTIHSAIHSARKDLNCIIHVHTAAGAAVSAMKCGLLPLCQEAMTFGPISYHTYNGIVVDESERASLANDLGPVNKVMILNNHGILAMGKTVEEAFVTCFNVVRACETQVLAFSVGAHNLIQVNDDIARKVMQVSIASGGGVSCHDNFGRGELEFEAMMRILDSLGYNTGYPYKADKLLYPNSKEERLVQDEKLRRKEHRRTHYSSSMTKDKPVVNGYSDTGMTYNENNLLHPPTLPSSLPPTLPSSLSPSLPPSHPPTLSSSLPPSLPPTLPSSLPPSLPSPLPSSLPSSLPPLLPPSLPATQSPFSYPPPSHTSMGLHTTIGTNIYTRNYPTSTGTSLPTSMETSFPTRMGMSHSPSLPASIGTNLSSNMGMSHSVSIGTSLPTSMGTNLPISMGMSTSQSKPRNDWSFLDERIADSSPIGFRKAKTTSRSLTSSPLSNNRPIVTPMYHHQHTSTPVTIPMYHQPTSIPIVTPMYHHQPTSTPMYHQPTSAPVVTPKYHQPTSAPVVTPMYHQPTSTPVTTPMYHQPTSKPMYYQPTNLPSSLKSHKERSPERVQFNPTVTYDDESPPHSCTKRVSPKQTPLNINNSCTSSSSSSSSLSSLTRNKDPAEKITRHKDGIRQRHQDKRHDHSSPPSSNKRTHNEGHTSDHTSSSSSSSSLLLPAVTISPKVPTSHADLPSLLISRAAEELTGLEKVMRTAEQVAQSTGASVEKLSKSLSLPPDSI